MNVLVASHLYPSEISLTWGSFVHNQVRFLGAHCQMRVVSPTPYFPFPGCGRWGAHRQKPRWEIREGIEVLRPRYLSLPRRLFFSRTWRSYLRALGRAERRPPPDLIHAHCAYPDGLAAVEYGRRLGRPVVLTVHGHDLKDLPQNPRWRALVVEALARARAVIAVSRELRERALALGAAADKVEVIPNGVDCRLFTGDFSRRAGEGGWRLLYIGRFDAAKGLGVLLEALGRLRRRRRDLHLTLVGGSAMTGTERGFRQRACELGLEECVDFVPEVPWSEIPRYMAQADLFLLPSFSEGLPLVLVEAMACGLPIVATRCGGPVEIVEEEVGCLAAVGDVEGLERAVVQVLENYRRYDRRAIRRRAEERYDYGRVAARIAALYARVLKQ